MSKLQIAVLFGGASSEHEVSRMSATTVLRAIDKSRYEVTPVGIKKDGSWWLYPGDIGLILDGRWESCPDNLPAFLVPDASVGGLLIRDSDHSDTVKKIDCVIPALHGKNGEDGTIQGLLQLAGIPFVGCDMTSSAACMDKVITNVMLEQAGIPQARFTWLYAYEFQSAPDEAVLKIEKDLGSYPVFVKPANAGSSVGVSKAENREELRAAIAKAAKEDGKILIEENIVGQEVECAVLGNEDDLLASTVGEIAPSNEFYDYEAKYLSGTSGLYIPAHLESGVIETIRSTAQKAYQVLGCSGVARVDFFVRNGTEVLLNELNTLPGFTSISMYPKLMEHEGLSNQELIHRLIQLAVKRMGKGADA